MLWVNGVSRVEIPLEQIDFFFVSIWTDGPGQSIGLLDSRAETQCRMSIGGSGFRNACNRQKTCSPNVP